jgi:hypothetical protein
MSDSKLKKAAEDCNKAFEKLMAARAEIPRAYDRGNKILAQCQINLKYLQRNPNDEDVREQLRKNTDRLAREGAEAAIKAAEKAEDEYIDSVNAFDKLKGN